MHRAQSRGRCYWVATVAALAPALPTLLTVHSAYDPTFQQRPAPRPGVPLRRLRSGRCTSQRALRGGSASRRSCGGWCGERGPWPLLARSLTDEGVPICTLWKLPLAGATMAASTGSTGTKAAACWHQGRTTGRHAAPPWEGTLHPGLSKLHAEHTFNSTCPSA